MLVARSEARIGNAGVKSTILLEREVRGTVILRDGLAFDSRFAAAAAGKLEPVGHVFLLLEGRFVSDDGVVRPAPVAHMLGDDELERVRPGSRTFRTDGPRAHVIQLRIAKGGARAPIGISHGPLRLSDASWAAAGALVADAGTLGRLLDALAADGVTDPRLSSTVIAEEPERFSRLWGALEPLYATYGGTTSLKQLAASLGLSLRQISRDAKELARAFGFSSGYRDALLMLRLRTAVLLLSARDASIADVARVVGYGSAIAMARAFRDAKLPAPTVVQDAMRNS